jgi:hypothetical protein
MEPAKFRRARTEAEFGTAEIRSGYGAAASDPSAKPGGYGPDSSWPDELRPGDLMHDNPDRSEARAAQDQAGDRAGDEARLGLWGALTGFRLVNLRICRRNRVCAPHTSPSKLLVMFGTDFWRLQEAQPAIAAELERVARERRQELLRLESATSSRD